MADSSSPSRTRRRVARGGRGGAEPRIRLTARAARVVELSLTGATQRAIAAEVGVSQPAVCKILRREEEAALATLHRDRVRLLVRDSRRLAHLYREAHEAWRRSLADRERRVQRRTTRADGHVITTMALHTETQAGDPRLLQVMLQTLRATEHLFALSGFDWPAIAAAQEAGDDGPVVAPDVPAEREES